MARMNVTRAIAVVAIVFPYAVAPAASQRASGSATSREISIANIERTLRTIDVDRTSGSEGERRSAEFLDRQLAAYGVAHTLHDARLFLSWPGRAEIT